MVDEINNSNMPVDPNKTIDSTLDTNTTTTKKQRIYIGRKKGVKNKPKKGMSIDKRLKILQKIALNNSEKTTDRLNAIKLITELLNDKLHEQQDDIGVTRIEFKDEKITPKIAPKVEQKVEQKVEPKVEQKVEQKVEPKVEQNITQKTIMEQVNPVIPNIPSLPEIPVKENKIAEENEQKETKTEQERTENNIEVNTTEQKSNTNEQEEKKVEDKPEVKEEDISFNFVIEKDELQEEDEE